ncbi:hypothetical protein [Andreprevotia chitinilytica]|uniref:hypothetical protein n=1 Tax=Andreprevotia chitinilytica TaxID=396808 RepID=UPI0005503013|nr:hypothetical protein [Andreprevotia chitinilytica]
MQVAIHPAVNSPAVFNANLLCAERVSGPLSLGQLVSGLRQRLFFQARHTQYLMLDSAGNDRATLDAVADHLAFGIDPSRVVLFEPSRVAEFAALRDTLAGLSKAPTPAMATTVALAALRPALISSHAATATDVAAANAVVREVNARAGQAVLSEARPLFSESAPFAPPRVALDVPFSTDPATLAAVIDALPASSMLGLPERTVEGNPLFQLLDVFERDLPFLDDLKSKFRRGGLSERVIKLHLADCTERVLAPLRERRNELLADQMALQAVLEEGMEKARRAAAQTLDQLRGVLA